MNDPVKLPVTFKHDWKSLPEQRIAECSDGNSRTLRTCFHCGLVKVTVHAGDGARAWRMWRMWRTSADKTEAEEWPGGHTPPCSGPTRNGEAGVEQATSIERPR